MAHPGIVFLDEPRRRFNMCGIFGCLISILAIPTLGLLSPLGLLVSLIGMTARPRGAATVGMVLGGMGTAFLVVCGLIGMATHDALEYEHEANRTEVVLRQAVHAINQYKDPQDRLPRDIDGNKLLIEAKLDDAWGNSLRYDLLGDDKFVVRSAGPDEKFDTGDDLTMK